MPGTVEIEWEHEIDTSAAVPGTDMYAGSEALRPLAGDGWSPRPQAASNLGERRGERGALKSAISCRLKPYGKTRSRLETGRSRHQRRGASTSRLICAMSCVVDEKCCSSRTRLKK